MKILKEEREIQNNMDKKLIVTTSPFLRDNKVSTKSLMIDVCIALCPAIIASVIFFGLRALILISLAVISSVFFEYLFQVLSKKKPTINDFSAVVTGILIGLNIPASAPFWIPIFGSLVAIILVKQLFGGIGQNFMNPALVARTLMFISWTALMSANILPSSFNFMNGLGAEVDFVSAATPLSGSGNFTFLDLFLGNIPGMLGETSKLALLIGGIFLIIRKVIDWRTPVFMIATVFLLYWIKTGMVYSSNSVDNALSQILSGGLFLGAFFMATDYVTAPIYKWGRVAMGIGCGVFVFIIRAFGNYPEGVSFAILFMNVATPLIDKYTMPKSFGEA